MEPDTGPGIRKMLPSTWLTRIVFYVHLDTRSLFLVCVRAASFHAGNS